MHDQANARPLYSLALACLHRTTTARTMGSKSLALRSVWRMTILQKYPSRALAVLVTVLLVLAVVMGSSVVKASCTYDEKCWCPDRGPRPDLRFTRGQMQAWHEEHKLQMERAHTVSAEPVTVFMGDSITQGWMFGKVVMKQTRISKPRRMRTLTPQKKNCRFLAPLYLANISVTRGYSVCREHFEEKTPHFYPATYVVSRRSLSRQGRSAGAIRP